MRTIHLFLFSMVAADACGVEPPAYVAAEPPAYVTPAGCVCGDGCTCEKDTCPKKCPVAVTTHKPPAGYPPAPAGFHWAVYPGGVWGLVQDGVTLPVQSAPVAPQTFAPFQPFPVLGGCPNGNCPRR